MEELYVRGDISIDYALDKLSSLMRDGSNLASGSGDALYYLNPYLAWTENAERTLRHLFESSAVWQGLFTDRFWRLREAGDHTPRPGPLMGDEIRWQVERLGEIHGRLKRLRDAFAVSDGVEAVMPDTNVFLHCQMFDQLPWQRVIKTSHIRLVVPLVVIDELDDIKYRDRKVSGRAREVLRRLQELRATTPPEQPVTVSPRASLQVLMDVPGHNRRPNNDDEFLSRAEFLSTIIAGHLTVVSIDTGMRLRAAMRNLPHIDLPLNLRVDSALKKAPSAIGG